MPCRREAHRPPSLDLPSPDIQTSPRPCAPSPPRGTHKFSGYGIELAVRVFNAERHLNCPDIGCLVAQKCIHLEAHIRRLSVCLNLQCLRACKICHRERRVIPRGIDALVNACESIDAILKVNAHFPGRSRLCLRILRRCCLCLRRAFLLSRLRVSRLCVCVGRFRRSACILSPAGSHAHCHGRRQR